MKNLSFVSLRLRSFVLSLQLFYNLFSSIKWKQSLEPLSYSGLLLPPRSLFSSLINYHFVSPCFPFNKLPFGFTSKIIKWKPKSNEAPIHDLTDINYRTFYENTTVYNIKPQVGNQENSFCSISSSLCHLCVLRGKIISSKYLTILTICLITHWYLCKQLNNGPISIIFMDVKLFNVTMIK